MEKVIEGIHMNKSYQVGKDMQHVLKDVSVTIYQGEFVSVMGPSGSGKSTLLYALSGMESIDNGRIQFNQQNLNRCNNIELSDIRRRQMGFVFQHPVFLKNITVMDNIILPSMRDNRKKRKQLVKRAYRLCEQTGIAHVAKLMPYQLSGGLLQRADKCRALLHQPIMLFGDEPTGALNSTAAQDIMNYFQQANNNGTTILLVTHDTKVAAQCERILFMNDGGIVDELQLGKRVETDMNDRNKKVTKKMLEAEV